MEVSTGFSDNELTENVFVHKMVGDRECIVCSIGEVEHLVVKFFNPKEILGDGHGLPDSKSLGIFSLCESICKNMNILVRNNDLNERSFRYTVVAYTQDIKDLLPFKEIHDIVESRKKAMFALNKKPNEGSLKDIRFSTDVQDKRPVIIFRDESQRQLVFQFYSHEKQSERYNAGLQLHNRYDCNTAVVCESLCGLLNQLVRAERLTSEAYDTVLACYTVFLRNHLSFSELENLVKQVPTKSWN